MKIIDTLYNLLDYDAEAPVYVNVMSFKPLSPDRYKERLEKQSNYLLKRGIHYLHDGFKPTLAVDTNICATWKRHGFEVSPHKIFYWGFK
jgi:hypothetical protein